MNARSRIYLRANKKKARAIADNKFATKRILAKHGISTAELVSVIRTSKELQEFDVETLPKSFVIKPNRGLGGQGILVIYNRLKNGNWLSTNKREFSAEDIRAHINNILDGNFSLLNAPDIVLIESRLSMSPLFKRFSTSGIPDIRVIVYNNVPVMAMLRVPTVKSAGKANLAQGGLGIGIDITTGMTTFAVTKGWLYEKEIDKHPDTGATLRGVKVPMWNQILETAVLAAHVTGLKYAGVDISVDKQRGPVVLELNARPGLGIQVANMLPLRERLDRIKGLKVKTPERGIAIAKELFAGQFEAEVENLTGRRVIGLVEPVSIWADPEKKKYVYAKVDTGAELSSIDESLARELGFGEAIDAFLAYPIPADEIEHETNAFIARMKKDLVDLHPDIADIATIRSSHGVSVRMKIRLTIDLDGRVMTIKPNIYDRSNLVYPILLGVEDMGYYIVDPSKPLSKEARQFRTARLKEKKEQAAAALEQLQQDAISELEISDSSDDIGVNDTTEKDEE